MSRSSGRARGVIEGHPESPVDDHGFLTKSVDVIGDVQISGAQSTGESGLTSIPWTLNAGDCDDRATGLVTLADLSIDVTITDPPYSDHVHTNTKTTKGGAKGGAVDLGFEPLSPWLRSYVAWQLARVTRRWVLVFTDEEGAYPWRMDLEHAGLEYVRTGRWIRKGAPQITGDRPAVGDEAIVICHQRNPNGTPTKKRWNGGGGDAVYDVPLVFAIDKQHPSQKPPRLMDALVADFTEPGELVLDPFAGSGSTLAAAVKAGRRAIGWERDAEHAATTRARLSGCQGRRVEGQGELFAAVGGAA